MNYTVSIRKRSDTWSYQILVDGKYYSSESGFKTKQEAKKTGDKVASRIINPVKSKDSFKVVADLYIKDGRKELTTMETYNRWLKVYTPIFDIEMLKLSYADVAPVINEYYLNHKYNGSQSILRFGRSIVDFAINKLDYDMRNPFKKISLERKSNNGKKEHLILTMDEMKQLFDKIENPDIRFLTMCFGLAGMRLSEARGLTFDCFKDNDIVISQQRVPLVGQKLVKGTMKSYNSARDIPLHKDLKKAYQEIPISFKKDRLIIEKFYQSNNISKVYRSLGYDITPHSLRHAYVTSCIQQGLDYKTIADYIGDTVEMVMKTYAHVNMEMKDHAREVLTNL